MSGVSSLASCLAAARISGVLRAAMACSSASSAFSSADPAAGGGGRKREASTCDGSSSAAPAADADTAEHETEDQSRVSHGLSS